MRSATPTIGPCLSSSCTTTRRSRLQRCDWHRCAECCRRTDDVAHVLYKRIGDDSTSALALAYVMAHLIGNVAMTPDGSRPSTIMRAGR